jgi:hypothetical protein
MAKKPNYGQERASRDRDRAAKKQEKVRRRSEDAAQRQAAPEAKPEPEDSSPN